ncbi:MAG: clostripain-related cysteine peptidase [Thermoplasmata archaeon]
MKLRWDKRIFRILEKSARTKPTPAATGGGGGGGHPPLICSVMPELTSDVEPVKIDGKDTDVDGVIDSMDINPLMDEWVKISVKEIEVQFDGASKRSLVGKQGVVGSTPSYPYIDDGWTWSGVAYNWETLKAEVILDIDDALQNCKVTFGIWDDYTYTKKFVCTDPSPYENNRLIELWYSDKENYIWRGLPSYIDNPLCKDIHVDEVMVADGTSVNVQSPKAKIEFRIAFIGQDLDGDLLLNWEEVNVGRDSCKKDIGTWTYLVYMAADDSALGGENYDAMDLNEMENIGSSSTVTILVYHDDYLTQQTPVYYIQKDNDPTRVCSNVLFLTEERSTGNPTTLIDFILWGVDHFPATYYAIEIWGHGDGWKGCAPDYTSNMDNLSLAELRFALQRITESTNERVSLMVFDACLMGTIEVAWEIRNYVDYIVFSQATVPSRGFNYATIFSELQKLPTPDRLGSIIVNSYVFSYRPPEEDITLSAIQASESLTSQVLSNMYFQLIKQFSRGFCHFIHKVLLPYGHNINFG